MSALLQQFHYGSPPPKNVIKSEDRKTPGDPINHPASEILKAIGKFLPNERIIIFVKDAAQAKLECELPVDITFRENSPDTAKEIQDEGIVDINSEAPSAESTLRICVIGAASPVAKTMINLQIPFEVWLQIRTDTGSWRHGIHCASTPIGILSSEKWQEKFQNLISI